VEVDPSIKSKALEQVKDLYDNDLKRV